MGFARRFPSFYEVVVIGATSGKEIRRFLEGCFGQAEIEWQTLRAEAVVDFVRREAAKLQPVSCRLPVTALRVLVGYRSRYGRLEGIRPTIGVLGSSHMLSDS